MQTRVRPTQPGAPCLQIYKNKRCQFGNQIDAQIIKHQCQNMYRKEHGKYQTSYFPLKNHGKLLKQTMAFEDL